MKNSVAALAIIASFAIGTIVTATPQVEAAGGWKEAFDQLLVQINVLEDKVQTLENTVNCHNEFLFKSNLLEFELSPTCQTEVIPLSITADDVSTTGTYTSELVHWYIEETGEVGEEYVYLAECYMNFVGEFNEDATFYEGISINSISVENDGTFQLVLLDSDGLFQSGVHGEIPELSMTALTFEKTYGAGLGTPEELIGTFSILAEVTVSDIFGNTVSDTATYTCSP